jgi:selenocysteine lyase/cysteine desulfurase
MRILRPGTPPDLAQGAEDDAFFEALRRDQYARLDAAGLAYLDYTASGLHARCQVEAQARALTHDVLGNPHSDSGPSRRSTALADAARRDVLEWLGVNEETHVCLFTANASAALRAVGEAFPFRAGSRFVLSADNHNSVNGLRQFARSRGAEVEVLPFGDELRLPAGVAFPDARPGRASLLAFPVQSNFSGVRHPLELVERARAAGYSVLLDAAAFLPTSRLDLSRVPADFVALSFYKLFGLPVGVGALVARREALDRLERPWFSGGAVEWASVAVERHRLLPGAAGFEDGTLPFLDLHLVSAGLGWLDQLGWERLGRRVSTLTAGILERLSSLRHGGGRPLVQLHGPPGLLGRGGTVTFTLRDEAGAVIPYERVERRADEWGVVLRGGCFCNPGASEAAFGWSAGPHVSWLQSLEPGSFRPTMLAERLGGRPVGALRVSVGVPTVARDLDRLNACLETFLFDRMHASGS